MFLGVNEQSKAYLNQWRNTVIEHKRCPTGKIPQQQNQNQNRPVQNANTSHAAEAPTARRKTRWVRVGRRAGCASQNATVARRKTRRVRAARRAGCAPQDAPGARRKTRRERAARRAGCTPRARAGVFLGQISCGSSLRCQHVAPR